MTIRPILSALLRSKTGALLVATQVALTLAILCNATYIVGERLETARRPTGVDEAGLFQIVYVGGRRIEDRAAMRQRDKELLRAIPGVTSVAETNQMPLARSGWSFGLSLIPDRAGFNFGAAVYFSGDSLVETLGLDLVEGRDFTPAEMRELDSDSGSVRADTTIISRGLARRMFPGETSVAGKTIYMGGDNEAVALRIVGVVDQLMSPWGQLSDRAHETLILPVRFLTDSVHYAVRTEPARLAAVMAQAEKELTGARNDRVLIWNRSMQEIREDRYRNDRAGALMLVAVTIGLLLVTASGIVGVASLWVSQRRKQIGVRRALGARRGDIVRYFLTENLMITTAGIVVGVGLAFALNQLVVSDLETERLPLPFLLGGMLVLWGLGLVAVLGPAWRAARVPPAVATRAS